MWLISAAFALPTVNSAVHSGMHAPGDAAVVIGIEDYAELPDVPFADADADAMWTLLTHTRGIPASRVRKLTGAVSNLDIESAVEAAGDMTSSGGTVFVYFAGHGAASPTTRQRLLLGFDTESDSRSLDSRGIAVNTLRERAGRNGARVVLIVDACYGGYGRDGHVKMEARWVVPVDVASAEWVAAGPDQVARPLNAARHGAFTYAVAGAWRGWADGEIDGTADGAVTGLEAESYVVRRLAELGIEGQTPSMSAELRDLVLAEGRLESARQTAAHGGVSSPTAGLVEAYAGGGVFGGLPEVVYGAGTRFTLGDTPVFVSARVGVISIRRNDMTEEDRAVLEARCECDVGSWNTILSASAGVGGRLPLGALDGVGGLEFTTGPFSDTFDLYVGGRAWAGLEWPLSRNFALTLTAEGSVLYAERLVEVSADYPSAVWPVGALSLGPAARW